MRLKERMWRHKKDANKGVNRPICNAIRKHGFDSFTLVVLSESCNREELLRMEIEAIKQHSTLHPLGYNYTAGGDGSRGVKHSAGFKQALSLRLKSAWKDPEYKAKHSLRMKTLAAASVSKRKTTLANRSHEDVARHSANMSKGQLSRVVTNEERTATALKRATTRALWSDDKIEADKAARSKSQLARYAREKAHV